MAPSNLVVIPVLVALAIAGIFCGPVSIASNGFGDASWIYFNSLSSDPAATPGFPGAPKPHFRNYTGVANVDVVLAALAAFFSGLLDGDVAPEYTLYAIWAFLQFMSLSVLVILEGFRPGNKGKLVAWTSTMLLFAQAVSWQFLIPLWVALYLATSPIAKTTSSKLETSLLIDRWDIAVLPVTVLFSMVIPTVLMFLPPSMISAKAHYASIAFWQPFPAWHYLLHLTLSSLARVIQQAPATPTQSTTSATFRAYLPRIRVVYDAVFWAGAAGQLSIILLTNAPQPLLSTLVKYVPALTPYTASSVSLYSIFAPWYPPNQPIADPDTIGSGDLAPLTVFFLHYDMYIGCGALLIWAVCLHQRTLAKGSLTKTLLKALGWFMVGGFAAAVAALLWERDNFALQEAPLAAKEKKKN
ncbi:hypothetical protein BX600DRAFT_242600 [Xylariales sp. PMI_506]|nr:hypothetical protein BX600DRAFT_242600 [Xylariales sp. PMI_506]